MRNEPRAHIPSTSGVATKSAEKVYVGGKAGLAGSTAWRYGARNNRPELGLHGQLCHQRRFDLFNVINLTQDTRATTFTNIQHTNYPRQ